MANPFRKIPPGSPVTAFSITAWNRMIDMLNWWQTVVGGGRGGFGGFVDWDQTVFRCRNDTAADLASYAVVGLDGPLWTPTVGLPEFLTQTSLKGVKPTVADHTSKWGVMLEATPDGAIGRCCLTGVTPLRVYCTSYLDTRCDIIVAKTVEDETVYVGSGSNGFQILWWEAVGGGDDGTIVWAVVRLGSPASSLGVHWAMIDQYTSETEGEGVDFSLFGGGNCQGITNATNGYEIHKDALYLLFFRAVVSSTGNQTGTMGFAVNNYQGVIDWYTTSFGANVKHTGAGFRITPLENGDIVTLRSAYTSITLETLQAGIVQLNHP